MQKQRMKEKMQRRKGKMQRRKGKMQMLENRNKMLEETLAQGQTSDSGESLFVLKDMR